MMALAQPGMRLGGPSWDEEVVPALRKRLESESRTLSKRMSAISLAADDGPAYNYSQPQDSSTRQHSDKHSKSRNDSRSRTPRPSPLHSENSGSGSSTGPSRVNPNTAPRSRTYSQPDTVAAMVNGSTKVGRITRTADSANSSKHRHQPTRIPKPSRAYGALSNGNTPVLPQANGFPAYSPHHAPETHNGGKELQFPQSSTHSIVGLPGNRSTSGLMNEPAPFPASPSASTLASYPNGNTLVEEAQPRASIDSEERPFEHWYRGEVSRNGGVGELRVGRQQEMLEIANYGHMMRRLQGQKPSPGWNGYQPPYQRQDDSRTGRRRAGSIGGLTDVERQRGSVLFDDDGIEAMGRVLDEHPLTDLEGESDVASLASRQYCGEPDYIPGVGDISMTTVTPTMTSPAMSANTTMDERSTTPQPRSSESRSGQYPPTRIPSRQPRKSSDSRSVTPTMHNHPTMNGTYSHSKTPSPPLISPSSTNRSVSGQSTTTSTGTTGKRVVSPASTKKRTHVRSLRGKQAPPSLVKKQDTSKDNTRSVSQYPVPADGEDDMSYAIPTWTQPVPKTGNWDEVVLPVVARQKGLDEYYQTADGNPQAPKVDTTPAPAPGTFGYDPSKFRRREDTNEDSIEMNDFGQPPQGQQLRRSTDERQEEPPNNDEFQPYTELYSSPHDETRLPVRPSPSPAPFAAYAPPKPTHVQARPPAAAQQLVSEPRPQQPPPRPEPAPELDDSGAGCCKCTIM